MSARVRALQEIERLYGLIETMHTVELREAAARLQEAEEAIAVESGLVREARVEAWSALAEGDREGWAVADAQLHCSGHRQENLQGLRQERQAATEEARSVFLASRMQHEQMKAVVDAATERQRAEEERRSQSAADDRFLSRLRWSAPSRLGQRLA
jgi:hypothetical protein